MPPWLRLGLSWAVDGGPAAIPMVTDYIERGVSRLRPHGLGMGGAMITRQVQWARRPVDPANARRAAILNAGQRSGQSGAEIGAETTSGTPVSAGASSVQRMKTLGSDGASERETRPCPRCRETTAGGGALGCRDRSA